MQAVKCVETVRGANGGVGSLGWGRVQPADNNIPGNVEDCALTSADFQ